MALLFGLSFAGNIWQWNDNTRFRANDLKYRYSQAAYHGTDSLTLWLDDSVDLSKPEHVDFLRRRVDAYEGAACQKGIEAVNAALIREDKQRQKEQEKQKKTEKEDEEEIGIDNSGDLTRGRRFIFRHGRRSHYAKLNFEVGIISLVIRQFNF